MKIAGEMGKPEQDSEEGAVLVPSGTIKCAVRRARLKRVI